MAQLNTQPKCSACRFFGDYRDAPGGDCRRSAPKIFWSTEGDRSVTLWPEVKGHFACGEFEPLVRDIAPLPKEPDADLWRAALRVWREEQQWLECLGPAPGMAGCLAPLELLAEFAPDLSGHRTCGEPT